MTTIRKRQGKYQVQVRLQGQHRYIYMRHGGGRGSYITFLINLDKLKKILNLFKLSSF